MRAVISRGAFVHIGPLNGRVSYTSLIKIRTLFATIHHRSFEEEKVRTLITGGGGFIGSHLCERFLKEGHEVICVDNFITGSLGNLDPFRDNPKFTFIGHDISQIADQVEPSKMVSFSTV